MLTQSSLNRLQRLCLFHCSFQSSSVPPAILIPLSVPSLALCVFVFPLTVLQSSCWWHHVIITFRALKLPGFPSKPLKTHPVCCLLFFWSWQSCKLEVAHHDSADLKSLWLKPSWSPWLSFFITKCILCFEMYEHTRIWIITMSADTTAPPGFTSVPWQEKLHHGNGPEPFPSEHSRRAGLCFCICGFSFWVLLHILVLL